MQNAETLSKIQVMECMEICRCRKEAKANCLDCKYYGETCINAHTYAIGALRLMRAKEIKEELKRDEY